MTKTTMVDHHEEIERWLLKAPFPLGGLEPSTLEKLREEAIERMGSLTSHPTTHQEDLEPAHWRALLESLQQAAPRRTAQEQSKWESIQALISIRIAAAEGRLQALLMQTQGDPQLLWSLQRVASYPANMMPALIDGKAQPPVSETELAELAQVCSGIAWTAGEAKEERSRQRSDRSSMISSRLQSNWISREIAAKALWGERHRIGIEIDELKESVRRAWLQEQPSEEEMNLIEILLDRWENKRSGKYEGRAHTPQMHLLEEPEDPAQEWLTAMQAGAETPAGCFREHLERIRLTRHPKLSESKPAEEPSQPGSDDGAPSADTIGGDSESEETVSKHLQPGGSDELDTDQAQGEAPEDPNSLLATATSSDQGSASESAATQQEPNEEADRSHWEQLAAIAPGIFGQKMAPPTPTAAKPRKPEAKRQRPPQQRVASLSELLEERTAEAHPNQEKHEQNGSDLVSILDHPGELSGRSALQRAEEPDRDQARRKDGEEQDHLQPPTPSPDQRSGGSAGGKSEAALDRHGRTANDRRELARELIRQAEELLGKEAWLRLAETGSELLASEKAPQLWKHWRSGSRRIESDELEELEVAYALAVEEHQRSAEPATELDPATLFLMQQTDQKPSQKEDPFAPDPTAPTQKRKRRAYLNNLVAQHNGIMLNNAARKMNTTPGKLAELVSGWSEFMNRQGLIHFRRD